MLACFHLLYLTSYHVFSSLIVALFPLLVLVIFNFQCMFSLSACNDDVIRVGSLGHIWLANSIFYLVQYGR